MKKSRNVLVGTLAGLALAFGAGGACADIISYTLNGGNTALSGFPGPYATVEVNLTDSTHATITFTSLTNGNNVYLLGGAQAADVNVNATNWTLGTVTGTNSFSGGPPFGAPGGYTNGGANAVDGFGSFNQTIDSADGYTHVASQITFGLTDNSGTWASAANVLTGNSNGFPAAAHIFVCTLTSGSCSVTAPATGFATVPIPAAAWLFGSGLVGLIAIARRRIKGSDSPALA